MYEDRRRGFRRAVLLCACATALVAFGCGDDDDSGDDADASATEAAGTTQEASMEGTWTGEREHVHNEDGTRSGEATLEVDEQDGLTFTGTMTWSMPDGDASSDVVGAMTPDGALMAGAEGDGTLSFELVDDDTLDYCYVETGEDHRAVCGRLDKQD